jgi:serine/threonine-protein kinase
MTTAAMTQHQWKLGKYIIGSRIGGGMTSVHLATNTETNQQVVVKLIAEADEDAAAKIHAEQRGCEIQKQLAEKDARIPKIFGWGNVEGYFCVEMEYVLGKALDKTGKAGSGFAVTIAIEVCEVLELAHREGIVHGDIKPGNILDVSSDSDKTQRTTIRVLDFGVSRFLTSATRNPFRSIPYCSPEISLGADPTPLDDLWALCVTIYELVEGRLPSPYPLPQGEGRVRGQPLFENSACPADLRFILQKMFNPDLRARYQTASQLKADLLAFHHGKPLATAHVAAAPVAQSSTAATVKDDAPPKPAAKPRALRRLRAVLAVAVLLVLLVVTLIAARSANLMLEFARAANAAQPENQASILEAATAYRALDSYAGIPRMLMTIGSRSPGKLRETCLVFAGRIIAKYARELDLPERGNVSEREWKSALEVLTIGEQIESGSDVRAMMAYAKGHVHRINAESRIGISADPERKKNERAVGVDHYSQAEEYFNEALRHKPEWADAEFGLVRLYATVFPEMDKAEIAISQAQQWSGVQPLRLQFEMAMGHHLRAAELSREVIASLIALARPQTGPTVDLHLERARADLEAFDQHMMSALAYYDACLSRGPCWDARQRRARVGAMMSAAEGQRTVLAEMEMRQRIALPSPSGRRWPEGPDEGVGRP